MVAVVRTLILVVVAGGAVLGGFWFLQSDHQARQIEELKQLNRDLETKVREREAMIGRLSRARRLAHLEVTGQMLDEAGEAIETDIDFIELDDDGTEIGRQSFTVPGDIVYVDAWTVKFDHEDVALGDRLMGQTLVLFRRIFTEDLAPADGFEIDTPGAVPPGYAAEEAGRFEQRLWEHFWQLATDAEYADAAGVRVAQGEAVYKPMREGQSFELIVDAAGGMSLVPLAGEDPAAITPERDAPTGEGAGGGDD